MPTWDKILKEVEENNPLKNFETYVCNLSKETGRTTICYMSAFTVLKPTVPSPYHSIIDQDIQGFMTCSKGVNKKELDLILHTPGGDYEATKRIINYLQETYEYIRVYVPHMAMSGGTLIACSADEIYMGPYSSLGPTDPQIFLKNQYLPIDAVINEFHKAFEEVSQKASNALLWNERLNQIPFGMLSAIETMKDNANEYLKELLKKGNCKNKSDGEIDSLVELFGQSIKHSSHGKGICLKDALKENLNVKDLREDKSLEDAILSIYHSATIMFQQTTIQKVIVNNKNSRYVSTYSGKIS